MCVDSIYAGSLEAKRRLSSPSTRVRDAYKMSSGSWEAHQILCNHSQCSQLLSSFCSPTVYSETTSKMSFNKSNEMYSYIPAT